MSRDFADDEEVMRHALRLARQGIGRVEPNPAVGAVLVDERRRLIGEGWHRQFGGPHAEVEALRSAGESVRGATLFVTLEPCCHHGKTGPCSQAVIEAGISRVVIAVTDPAPHVAGGGIRELEAAGIDVEVGLLGEEAAELIAPFVMLQSQGRPWVHAKWAMTLDGRIAARTGNSQWISTELSRGRVHELRGHMDAILVGAGTARADDPMLTARPPGPRVPLRIVLDASASLSLDSRLMTSLDQAPVLIAATDRAPRERVSALRDAGAEVVILPEATRAAESESGAPGATSRYSAVDLSALLQELGRRQMTNLLVEGGSRVFGSLFDGGLIDEVHTFIAPRLVGGERAFPPFAGEGLAAIPSAPQLRGVSHEILDGDIYVHGRIIRDQSD